MIDFENQIFTVIRNAVSTEHTGIFVGGEYSNAPSQFPCAFIVQQDNPVYTKSISSSSRENHRKPMFEVNVYSNKVSGKKTEAKKIFATISDEFLKMGFICTSQQPIANLQDEKIYRIVGRFTAIISKQGHTYTH